MSTATAVGPLRTLLGEYVAAVDTEVEAAPDPVPERQGGLSPALGDVARAVPGGLPPEVERAARQALYAAAYYGQVFAHGVVEDSTYPKAELGRRRELYVDAFAELDRAAQTYPTAGEVAPGSMEAARAAGAALLTVVGCAGHGCSEPPGTEADVDLRFMSALEAPYPELADLPPDPSRIWAPISPPHRMMNDLVARRDGFTPGVGGWAVWLTEPSAQERDAAYEKVLAGAAGDHYTPWLVTSRAGEWWLYGLANP